jgi:type III secretion protein U
LSEKTEKPTPKRLRDAREKGQVAKSKEIATCAVIVGLFAYLWGFFGIYLQRMQYLVQAPAQHFREPFDQAMNAGLKSGFQELALLSLPFGLAAAAIAVLAYLMQIGFLVSFEPIKPDIKKISPVEGVKRIFSLSNLLELGKSIVKILLLGAIVYLLIRANVKDLLHTAQNSPQAALDVLAAILKKMVVAVSALFIVVAIVDHFFQKHLYIRKLKMSKEDIKREHKDREGDPHLKSRRKQLQFEMAMDDLAGKVRQATVVLVQGKKLAVAIYYEMGKTPLPIVSVKGRKKLAEKIISMAGRHGIPIIADAGLARELYSECEQDNYITSRYIEPVAEVLREVMDLNTGGGPMG